jgi:hypothetical protein
VLGVRGALSLVGTIE